MKEDDFVHRPPRRTFDENTWVSGLTIDLDGPEKQTRRALIGKFIQGAVEVFTAASALETIRDGKDLKKIRSEIPKSKREKSPLLYTGLPPIALSLKPITVDLSTDNSTMDKNSLFDSSNEVTINGVPFNQLSRFQVTDAPVVDYKEDNKTIIRAIKFILQKPEEGITEPLYVFYPHLDKVLPIKIINNGVYTSEGKIDRQIGLISDPNVTPTLEVTPIV